MLSKDVLSMYEDIAAITGKMASAAQAGDSAELETLAIQCAAQTSAAASEVTRLEGPARVRKIELLKQIMANDRTVREVTEPWADQLERIMRAKS